MRLAVIVGVAVRVSWLLVVPTATSIPAAITRTATTNSSKIADADFEAFYAAQLASKLAYLSHGITNRTFYRNNYDSNSDRDQVFKSLEGVRRSCGECCGYGPIQNASIFGMNSFYKKALDFRGFVIASSATVSDSALYEAALTLDIQTKYRPDLFQATITDGVHMAVLGRQEQLLDVPEYATLDPEWNYARGVSATRWIPVTSCAEENLLCLSTDVYQGENICSHENTHTLTGSMGSLDAPRYVEPSFPYVDIDLELSSVFLRSVTQGGLWGNTYASTSRGEYLAEGAQSFFNANKAGPAGGDGVHNDIDKRDKLQSYDPLLYDLLTKIFPTDIHSLTCPELSGCDCGTFVCPSDVVSAPTPTTTMTPTSAPANIPSPSPTSNPTLPADSQYPSQVAKVLLWAKSAISLIVGLFE